MKKYLLERDVTVFCVLADSFPQGILKAHQKLHALLLTSELRNFYGVSNVDKKKVIIYKAAVEELYEAEAQKYGCETYTIRKGEYISMLITDFRKTPQSISKAFEKLLMNPNIDPNCACIEQYFNDTDVKCMVRLKSTKK
ncbi:MAG: hypothetical protein WC209_01630 [Ignavibacteriaceae bacterium]|jgi:hypothetical protein